MLTSLAVLYERDLNKLIQELSAYPDEASLWQVQGEIINPAGNLALHLVGNLSQFIGEDLGGIPYQRDRDAEFNRRDVPRQELLKQLESVREQVKHTLLNLNETRLTQPHPRQLPSFPPGMTSGDFLLHLYGHLNWHLGQVNYHRRMIGTQHSLKP